MRTHNTLAGVVWGRVLRLLLLLLLLLLLQVLRPTCAAWRRATAAMPL